MTLDGKVAIVAGASRGIGADIAKYLARAGAKVAVGARTEVVRDPRLPGTIYSVAGEIAAEGASALPVVMNVRDPDSIEQAVQRTAGEWGGVDILVHNAAIFVPGDLRTAQLRHINVSLEVNVRGPVLTARAVLPHMVARGGGHIIFVSGGGGAMPGPARIPRPPSRHRRTASSARPRPSSGTSRRHRRGSYRTPGCR